jgi:hypothetical protein
MTARSADAWRIAGYSCSQKIAQSGGGSGFIQHTSVTAMYPLAWEARLGRLLHREGFVQKVLSAKSPRELYEVFAPSNERTEDLA